jgi:hypothetical protein
VGTLDYDSNNIFVRSLTNKTKEKLIEAHKQVYQELTKTGCKPICHRLENKVPEALLNWLSKIDMDFQLATHYQHRANATERAICTATNHIILVAGIATCEEDFPLKLWDRLLPQAELTLNLLQRSRINPKLSAWEQIHGHFDYNRTPFGSTRNQSSDPRDTRQKGNVVRPCDRRMVYRPGSAFNHYQLHTVYCNDSGAERTAGTLTWLIIMPIATPQDMVQAAIENLTTALKHPKQDTLAQHLQPSATAKLQEQAEIFTNNNDTVTKTLGQKVKSPLPQKLASKQYHLSRETPDRSPNIHTN